MVFSDSLQFSIQNMKLGEDECSELPNMGPYDATSASHGMTSQGRLSRQSLAETSDFTTAENVLKNFTLFIPEHLLQGTKFMSKLNLSDREVVKYSVQEGKQVDRLLFRDQTSRKPDQSEVNTKLLSDTDYEGSNFCNKTVINEVTFFNLFSFCAGYDNVGYFGSPQSQSEKQKQLKPKGSSL